MRSVFNHAPDHRNNVARALQQHPGATFHQQTRGTSFLRHGLSNSIGNNRQAAGESFEGGQSPKLGDHHIRRAHQLLNMIRIAYHFDRERSTLRQRFCVGSQFLISSCQKNSLNL